MRDENSKLNGNNSELRKLVDKNQDELQKLNKKFDTMKQNLRKNDNDDSEMKNEIVELRGKVEIIKNELNKHYNTELEEEIKEIKEQIEQLRNELSFVVLNIKRDN